MAPGTPARVGAQQRLRLCPIPPLSISGATTTASPAPGGGGSGGSIVVQSARAADLDGLLDVRGGSGGTWNRFANGIPNVPPNSASVQIAGGDGAAGFVRLELPQLPPQPLTLLANMQPAPIADYVSTLVETDAFATTQSKYYDTRLALPPQYLHYVVDVEVDGTPLRYSDDPSISTLIAGPGSPLRVWFQGAQLDANTNEPLQVGPWRTTVRGGLDGDGMTAFRFRIARDAQFGTQICIKRVAVVYRL